MKKSSQESRLSNSNSLNSFGLVLFAIFSLVWQGCGDSSKNEQRKLSNQTHSSSDAVNQHRISTFLSRAINLIKGETLTNLGRFENSVTQSLNSAWNQGKDPEDSTPAAMKKETSNWKKSDLLSTLPKEFQETIWFKNVEETDFIPSDAFYVQESFWLDQLQDRIISGPKSNRFLFLTHAKGQTPLKLWEALKKRDPRLDARQAQALADAMFLFDWTVRNVSGDDFYGPVVDETIKNNESLVIGQNDRPNSARGIRGPGYTRQIWQLLQYGRGDGWQRGHLFLQLARHAGLNACVLGVPDKKASRMLPAVAHKTVLPWVIGVAIGDQIYLFDSRLGMPLYHKDTLAVLSLQDVAKDASLLRWQGLTPDESTEIDAVYPVEASELKNLVALIDYPLESLSLRMQFLQNALTGKQRIPLTFDPEPVAKAFEKSPLISRAELWGLPTEILVFRSTVEDALKRATRDRIVRSKVLWVHNEETYINEFPLIREARLLFVLGKFKSDHSGLKKDCRKSLLDLLYTEKEIGSILTDRTLQKRLGLYQEDQTDKDFKAATAGMQSRMRLIRNDVQMYLANTLTDMEEYSSSLNWLGRVEKSLLSGKSTTVEKWSWAADYLKGRCLEAIGKFDDAVSVFEKSAAKTENRANPQRYGNVLRARILKDFQKKQK